MRAVMAVIDGQRGHLFGWTPVLFALGIGAYFAASVEPSLLVLWAAGGCAAALLILALAVPAECRFAFFAIGLILGGFAVAGGRAHDVGAPVLSFRYYGPIEGRVVMVDRSASGAVRLTLDRVVLARLSPERTPERVRISLHGTQGFLDPRPGQIVGMTGHLSPPSGPVEPGSLDFQLQAWFQGLGAVGYTRVPAVQLAPSKVTGFWMRVTEVRLAISSYVQGALPGRVGAFASAVTTGDRSGMDAETLQALRASNLAHLLAISGLHMGLLTGFVFALLRYALILIPHFGLVWPVKKVAAVGAMGAGTAYLLLSGGNVATERAFIMVSVMFVAVLLDRRAVTLRAVAVAAMIVLALRPEQLMGPGFQMSFSATVALVAVYALMRERDWSQSRWPRVVRYAGGVALSSAVAGAATAPFAAAHFNQVPHFGLVANMAAVPVMGAVVIPGAVLAAVLAPFGLSSVGFAVMAPAIAWILVVADAVSGWPMSLSRVPSAGAGALPLIGLGGLIFVLWQGRARVLGVVPVAVAIWLWVGTERPAVLVSDTGGLIGVMVEDGRALSKAKGDGFSARSWLENDGDLSEQFEAFARWDGQSEDRLQMIEVHGVRFLHATGKVAGVRAIEACASADYVVVNIVAEGPEHCEIFDIKRLRETGALAIDFGPEGASIKTARAVQGARLWSQ